jgi:hypothetical protein
MKSTSSGECLCGRVVFSIELPEQLEKYSPRACDCDFCTRRSISYLSHPGGVLEIECSEPFDVIQQGSNQAMFLSCADCGSVVAVVHQLDGSLKGAVNAVLLKEFERLQEPIIVSPRLLSPEEKRIRWEGIWASVRVNGQNRI